MTSIIPQNIQVQLITKLQKFIVAAWALCVKRDSIWREFHAASLDIYTLQCVQMK